MAFFALWQINRIAKQLQKSEEDKVRLWASAIGQQNQLTAYAEEFFDCVSTDEHRKMQLYTKVLHSFGRDDLGSNAEFALAFVNYIMDSSRTATIITGSDSVITSCRNVGLSLGYTDLRQCDSADASLIGKKLRNPLLADFQQNPPFHYKVWGMPFTLYYKESVIYSNMRQMIAALTENFLNDIANNSINVPVIIIDSAERHVVSYGNIRHTLFDTPEKLEEKLSSMAEENTPIAIQIPMAESGGLPPEKLASIPERDTIVGNAAQLGEDTALLDFGRSRFRNTTVLVYYEQSPLLHALHWVPLLYILVVLVLVAVTYYLIRTTRAMEQNKIYVGLAKETAHQLGTPISSLIAWTDYLEGRQFNASYAGEVRKDLERLETVAARFSKIGSRPQLEEGDVRQVIENTITYLRTRTSKKIDLRLELPDTPMLAPISAPLLQWVIENLTKNAIDALSPSPTTGMPSGGQEPLAAPRGAAKGKVIAIKASQNDKEITILVCDNGCGIAPAAQKHIFDSGFTTKTRGWGLGLPLAKRIIEEYHHGKIVLIESTPNRGTTFGITLRKQQ